MEKRTKDVYGPPLGKRLALCVDDLNMPKIYKYVTQQPLALLRLFVARQVGMLGWACLRIQYVESRGT